MALLLSAVYAQTAGLTLAELTAADRAALARANQPTTGARIELVAADSSAARGGLRAGDLLLAIGGKPVSDAAGAQALLQLGGETKVRFGRKVFGTLAVTELTLQLPVSAPAAPGLYRDPAGRFEFGVPEGYAVQELPNQQGVSFTQGDIGITIMVFENQRDSGDLVDLVHDQIVEQTKEYEDIGFRQVPLLGQLCPCYEYRGINPKGVKVESELLALVEDGRGFVILYSLPPRQHEVRRFLWAQERKTFRILNAPAAPQPQPVTPTVPPNAGLVLQQLDAGSLDSIQRQTGRRVGVLVTAVLPDSPAAQAGIRPNDILFVVNHQGVASPAEVEAALQAAAGAVDLFGTRLTGDRFETLEATMQLPGGGGAATTTTTTTAPQMVDPVTAYFDMLDFSRTEAWGRQVRTSDAERQRIALLVNQLVARAGPQAASGLQQLSAAWAQLQQQWAAAPEAKRQAQREFWRTQVLLPTQFLPPPAQTRTYAGAEGIFTFEYPADWMQAENSIGNLPVLYLGPPGTQASWQQVLAPLTMPPGVLWFVGEIDQQLASAPSLEQAARIVAQQVLLPQATQVRELNVTAIGDGAVASYAGPNTSQGGEWFYWVGVAPLNNTHYIGARFGGPLTQAEHLLPSFCNMVASLEFRGGGGGGGGGTSEEGALATDYAMSVIGNAVASSSWHD